MPGRKFPQGHAEYRYGFNGKEHDKEVVNTSSYDYGFRIYSPALARFLSVDPLQTEYPWYTPYQFAGNNPIRKIDLDGLEDTDPPAFAKFDAKKVSTEIDERTKDPSKIDQSGTGLCGMACISYLFASKEPENYKTVATSLIQVGSGTNVKTGFHIRAEGDALGSKNRLLDIDPNSKSFPSGMAQIDFAFLASLKNDSNDFMDYDGDANSKIDQLSGISMPSGVKNLMEDFLGATNVKNNTNLIFSKGGVKALRKIDEAFQKGESVLMFINAGMLSNKTSSVSPNHWIVYKGALAIDESKKTIQFEAYSWGAVKNYSMSFEAFHDNFYGTVQGTYNPSTQKK